MIKTCSKESGQRLVELGVTKASYFAFEHHEWATNDGCGTKLHVTYEPKPLYLIPEYKKATYAYTTCELGEMLKEMNISYRWNLAGEFECLIHFGINAINDYETYDLDMPEAMALMLIWLLENGHITAEQISEAP